MRRTILKVTRGTYQEILDKLADEPTIFLGILHDAPEGTIDMYGIALQEEDPQEDPR
jgi:hypothetical protein